MTLEEVFENAKQHTRTCRVCRVCNGKACAGEIPGVGGKGTGSSFIRNAEALKNIRLRMNVLTGLKKADPSADFFGHKVSLPVYAAPITGMGPQYGSDITEKEYAKRVLEGASAAGTYAFTGDGKDFSFFEDPFRLILAQNGEGIPTMKPWVKKGRDMRTDLLKEGRPIAFATDIDAAGLLFLRDADPAITNLSAEDLADLKKMLGTVPLIVKGIMTADAAKKAVEAGADGIVVSNHGGRVLDDAEGTIEVLPEIVNAVKGRCRILIDGAFRSGADVFKALALGADGVLIGRPVALAALGGNAEGVKLYFEKIRTELREAMTMCGASSVKEINTSMVCVKK
ncbi:MAG: alpha-hydroxy-acid oxidizing protein [Erysipelotrichales bacterium]|nr:alpha-hydroxy-acid oxidizing protein [Erysipelotrichales bacterium]